MRRQNMQAPVQIFKYMHKFRFLKLYNTDKARSKVATGFVPVQRRTGFF